MGRPAKSPWLPALLLGAGLAGAVDLATCKVNIQARLDDNTLARNASIFYFNGTHHMSDRDNIWLTIEGCQGNCPKPFFDLYSDMWPRLLTWLVPALLLIGSVHLPRVGHVNRLFVIFHFMGDPIDSMWSLLTKGEIWNRYYTLALRRAPQGPDREPMASALAAMLSAFEELTGDMKTVQQEFDAITIENEAQLSKEDLDYILKETAEELVDSRSNEGLRTLLVIVNYLWAVLAALVPEIGGTHSSQPGGRIGTAMFLSWLMTAVLLSNTLSGFTSRRTCLRIMERYTRTMKGRRRDIHHFPFSPRLLARTSRQGKQEFEDFIDSQPWNGTVYSYRPRKRLVSTGEKTDRSPLNLLALSMAPVLIAAISAFVIIFYTPTIGLGCRTLWVLGLTAGMLFSPLLTWIISRILRGKVAWYITILKDAIFGLGGVTVILLSSIGIFNTCWCWSGVYSRGIARAFIDLDPQTEREYNLHRLYPAMVAACLLLQIMTYGFMHRIMKPGGLVFRPDEDEKMKNYRIIHGLMGSPLPETEMKGRPDAAVRRVSEAAPLLLPPSVMDSPGGSPLVRSRQSSYASPPLVGSSGRSDGFASPTGLMPRYQ